MALFKLRTCADYRSDTGSSSYTFTVCIDSNGCVEVTNIVGPFGPIGYNNTSLPESVSDDIQTAIEQLKATSNMSTISNGILSFNGETQKTVTFASPTSNTNYRVVFSKEDFILARVVSKTTTGFTVELNITYTGDVGYDVLV